MRQAISAPEAQLIINAATTAQDKLLIMMLWYTGGRISEVLALTPDRLGDQFVVLPNLKQHTFYIDLKTGEQKPIKTRRNRIKQIFIPYAAVEQLQDYITLQHLLPDQHIFPYSRITAWRRVKSIASAAHVMKVGRLGVLTAPWPHCFRHGAGENMYSRTHDLLFVKEQLGHAQLSTTQIYLDVSEETRRQYVEQYALP